MADGTPDFSDLLAAFEESPVVTTLHQIGSRHVRPGDSSSSFNQSNLAFPTTFPNQQPVEAQSELGQIAGLDSDLPNEAFMQTDLVQAPIAAGDEFGGANVGSGSLGSLFLSSIESQIDSGRNEGIPFMQPIPQSDGSKNITHNQSRPRSKAPHIPQIRSSNFMPIQDRNPSSSGYSPFQNNGGGGVATISLHNTAVGPGDLGIKSTNIGSQPFVMPSEVQPGLPAVQLGGPQKKSQNQYIYHNQSARQQQQSVNPPRPLSAASNTSEHLSRPGSVQQPSPSCASNHSGDPATPLTPQSFNAGTPQPYGPASSQSNLAVQLQKRSAGYGDVHNSQIPQSINSDVYMSSQHPNIGFQPTPSPIQTISASSEPVADLPTPIKDVFATPSSSASFNTDSDTMDSNNAWNANAAVMAPSALFSADRTNPASSNVSFVSPDQNLSFGFHGDMYGTQLNQSRISQRPESNVRGESLTAKQNALLDQLSASCSKKSSSHSVAPMNSMEVPELIPKSGLSGNPMIGDSAANVSTMDLMNKANTAGTATVEKLLGSHHQYEAISPVSDYTMSPSGKQSLPDELTDTLFSTPKFSSRNDVAIHHDQPSANQDLINDPVLMYTTKKSEAGNPQNEMNNFHTRDAIPELIYSSQSGWPIQTSVAATGSLGSANRQFVTTSDAGQPNFSFAASETGQSGSSTDAWNTMNVSSQGYSVSATSRHSLAASQVLSSFSHTPIDTSTALSQDALKSLPRSSPQKHLSPPALVPMLGVKDNKSFGTIRSKIGAEKPKSQSLAKKKESSETSFGFESDDDTETICLSKASPKQTNKRIFKQTQPNLISPKPRFVNSTTGNDDIQRKMEALRQLQQQQEKLRRMEEALQTQHGASSHVSHQNKQFHNRMTHLTAGQPQSQLEKTRRRMSVEKLHSQISLPMRTTSIESLASADRLKDNKSQHSSHAVVIPASSVLEHETAPKVSLQSSIHPAGYEDAPKYMASSYQQTQKPANVPFSVQDMSQFLPQSAENISGISSFIDTSQQKKSSDLVVSKFDTMSSQPPAQMDFRKRASMPLSSLNQTVPSTLPLHISMLLAAPSSSVSSSPSWSSLPTHPSAVSTSIGSAMRFSSANQAIITSTATQSSDNTHLNLDWLSRESERILLGKSQKAGLELRNNATSSNTSVPVTAMTAQQDSQHPSTIISIANAPNQLLASEDDILPLKQSNHAVGHLNFTPKSLPVVTCTSVTSASLPIKKTVPSEPRHLNFKKHRILEGARSSSPVKNAFTMSTAFSSSHSVTVAHSVLDKQRRYSKEHSSAKPKHRIPPQITNDGIRAPSTLTTSQLKSSDNASEINKKPAALQSSEKNQEHTQNINDKSKSKQEEKTGNNMFMLFNSLLQEASESAMKSKRNSKPESEEPVSSRISQEPAEQSISKLVPKPQPALPKMTTSAQPEPVTPAVMSAIAPIESSSSKASATPSQLPNKPVTVVSVAAPILSPSTIPVSREIKKPAKKNRPAATMPFKRRYIDESQSRISSAASLPVTTPVSSFTTTTICTAVTSSHASTVVNSPRLAIKYVTSADTRATKIAPVVSAATTSLVASTISNSLDMPIKNITSVPKTMESFSVNISSSALAIPAQSSPLKNTRSPQPQTLGGSLKMRITAFRSSKGDIIHQSSVLDKNEDGSELDRHKKHRKKKKKKERKKKVSSSDCGSPVRVSKSSHDQTARLVEEAKLNEKITKELEKKAQYMLKSSEEIAKISGSKEKSSTTLKKESLKRKRVKVSSVDNVGEAKKGLKRARLAKTYTKKKQDGKDEEPVARYLPKSILQATPTTTGTVSMVPKVTVTLPSTYQRAPGKLPLYLSSSDGKSSTAPTIQLVARNTSRIVSSASDAKATQSTKIMSVKVPSSLTSKSFGSQHLPNSTAQYAIPATRSQPRVILPSTSTVSVAVVSPLIVRSFPGSFVPFSVCTLTTTASTKPQLFSVPVSFRDGITNSSKKFGVKPVSGAKSQQIDDPLVTESTTSTQSSVLKSPLLKASSTVAVTGVLTTPWVTTKVISPTGSSQETTTNNFQSVFSKLISSPNPIATYVPPVPPTALQIDLSERQNISCLACEDRFLFEESLEDHYARRSIMIKVRCVQCDQDMVFLNKCKLIMHARQHSDGMQFNNALISPIPLWMCKPRSKESFINKSNDSISERRQSTVSSEDEPSMHISAGLSKTVSSAAMACTECNFMGATTKSLEEHFQRVSPPVSPDKSNSGNKALAHFTCDICSVTVPNQCSFLAHMRIHKKAIPHTCPECGKTFDDDGLEEHGCSDNKREIDFNLHLSIQCFHLSRMSAFKCRICSLICETAELLRRHLEVRHLQTFYKCRDCPMAFKTPENIASHQRSAHGVVAAMKIINKCPLCDTVFTDNSPAQQLFSLQKHFEGHMSHPSINITAYKCQFCKCIYEKKSLLRDHLKVAHDVTASGDGNSNMNVSQVLSDESLENAPSTSSGSNRKRQSGKSSAKEPVVKLSRIILPEKSTDSNALIASGILGKRDWPSGRRSSSDSPAVLKSTMQPLKLRLKGMTPGSSCREDSSALNTEGQLVPKVSAIIKDGRKVFPCGQCAKELPSASARINHIKLKHQGIRTLYCCPYCPPGKIKFAKKISMTKHLQKIHGMNEIKKQDVRIEYAKLPIGQRFDPAIVIENNEGLQSSPVHSQGKSSSTGSKVRKKITRPRRKPSRQSRQSPWDASNASPYVENSDSEDVDSDRSNNNSDCEHYDFSTLKFPQFYICATCEYQSNDRLEFQAHILEHKEDAEAEGQLSIAQQCTECGLCFASNASHTNHLFIKHKIKKKKLLEKYDEKLRAKRKAEGTLPSRLCNDWSSNNPDSGTDLNQKKQKCSVCFKRFESENQLRSHIRTHGLAFVKSKHTS